MAKMAKKKKPGRTAGFTHSPKVRKKISAALRAHHAGRKTKAKAKKGGKAQAIIKMANKTKLGKKKAKK